MPTPRTGAPEWVEEQALPEVTGNEIVRYVEQGAGHRTWKSRTTTAPPGSPAEGDEYLIPAGASAPWNAHIGEIAFWLNTAWEYLTPVNGMFAVVLDENGVVFLDDTSTWQGLGLTLDNDTTLAGDSPSTAPSQHAVKTYVDNKVTGLLEFKGSTDCSANPNFPAASKGDAYLVSVAGKIGGASGVSVDAGDLYVASADNAGGTQAAVGSSWFTLEHNGVFGAAYTDEQVRDAMGTALVQGTGVSITPNDGADTITIALSGGVQSMPVLAAAMTPRTTNGPGTGSTESSTNKVMLPTLDYDQSTIEYAQFMVPMPKSWNEGTVTAQFIWAADSGTAAQNVIWGIQGLALSDNDTIDAAFGTAQEVTDALQATGKQHTTSFTSAVTIGGTPAEGDLVIFQVYRKASDAGDTLAADARLIGIRLNFTTNAGDDS